MFALSNQPGSPIFTRWGFHPELTPSHNRRLGRSGHLEPISATRLVLYACNNRLESSANLHDARGPQPGRHGPARAIGWLAVIPAAREIPFPTVEMMESSVPSHMRYG